MEDILIGEKKYVSSKQAAKLTGYAKDYIGQLCREGRVPARLVGRSWYVLESAIHDHRFGKPESEGTSALRPHFPRTFASSAWDSPRYEAVSQDETHPIHQQPETTVPVQESSPDGELQERLHDSWKAWFDRVVEAAPPSSHDQESGGSDAGPENREVNIPLRTIPGGTPPDELLPRRRRKISAEEESEGESGSGNKKEGAVYAASVVGMLLAVSIGAIALINIGYFDEYDIISKGQASIISGVTTYEK